MKNRFAILSFMIIIMSVIASCSHNDDGPTGLEVGRKEMTFPATGASQTLIVRSVTQPLARTDAPWLTIGSIVPSGNSNVMWAVPLTASPNSGAQRSGKLVISSGDDSIEIPVNQYAGVN